MEHTYEAVQISRRECIWVENASSYPQYCPIRDNIIVFHKHSTHILFLTEQSDKINSDSKVKSTRI